jgi:hypothetical protein
MRLMISFQSKVGCVYDMIQLYLEIRKVLIIVITSFGSR